MRGGFRIIDVDRHVIEPVAMWRDYLPAHLQELAPEVTAFGPPESPAARAERLGEHAPLPTPPTLSVAGKPVIPIPEAAYIEFGLTAAPRRDALAAAGAPAGKPHSVE